MPLFACRWPNGDVSFVMAPSKDRAVELLDEIDNAEGCPIVRVSDFQIHLRLSDSGEFEFEQFGENTDHWVLRHLYPGLDEAWRMIGEEQGESDNPAITPEQQARILLAVSQERERVQPSQAAEPETLLGKDIKCDLNMPTSLVDKIVRRGLRRRLKRFTPGGKRH